MSVSDTPAVHEPGAPQVEAGERRHGPLTMLANARPSHGAVVFLAVWIGQLISLLGSALTGFALGVKVFEETRSASKFVLISLSTTLPLILVSPIAGALADRWDRRRAMIVGDTGAGLGILALALLLAAGRLALWHVYLATAALAIFGALHWAAYSAAVVQLVPKKHLGRASGMMQLAESTAPVAAPVIAGLLVVTIGVRGVLAVDLGSYAFALLILLAVRFPPTPRAAATGATATRPSLLRDAMAGFAYLRARPGLLALLALFAGLNLCLGMSVVLVTPLVLSFAPPSTLGTVLSAGGAGGLLGGLVMSAWGGPRRRVQGVLGFALLVGLAVVLTGARASAVTVGIGLFLVTFFQPLLNGSSQVIWQSKVAPEVQGRVFAVRRMIAWSTAPLAFLLGAGLADRVFGPLFAEAGRGIGMVFLLAGTLTVLTVMVGAAVPHLRRLEEELPDAIPDEVGWAADAH
jgi:MFS family permease